MIHAQTRITIYAIKYVLNDDEGARDKGRHLVKILFRQYGINEPSYKKKRKKMSHPEKWAAIFEFMINEGGFIRTAPPIFEILYFN